MDPDALIQLKPEQIKTMIINYIIQLKKVAIPIAGKARRGEISVNSIKTYLAGVQSFLENNEILLNWKKITKYYPEEVTNNLRAYTREEIAKLLLLKEAPLHNGRRKVKYAEEFVIHKVKTEKAFGYFQNNNFHVCMILAQGCPGQTSDVEEGNWDKVIVDLEANTEARLSIFYSDFVYDSNQNPVIESPPDVEPEMLRRATEQLVIATNGLPP
jgi:hypothetical protein